jgi:hypothetical protein
LRLNHCLLIKLAFEFAATPVLRRKRVEHYFGAPAEQVGARFKPVSPLYRA